MVREPQALGGTNSAPNPVDRHSLHPGTGTGPNAITAKAGGEHGQNHRVLDSHDDSRGFRPFSSDDLNAPLSQSENKKKKKSPLAKLTALEPHALAVVLSLFGLAVVVWGLFGNDPLGGEPVAVVSTSPPRANMAKADAGGDGARTMSNTTGRPQPATRRMLRSKRWCRPTAQPSPSSTAPAARTARSSFPARRPGLTEDAGRSKNAGGHPARPHPEGRLGRRAAIHALRFEGHGPAGEKSWPRIAVTVEGLGISVSGTADALAKLPAPIGFALTPYGNDLQKLAEQARMLKHIPTTIPARRPY